MGSKWEIYDCGCVNGRPKDQHCRMFGTRWRAYLTNIHVILKCRDCGRMHQFELRRGGVALTTYEAAEEITDQERELLENHVKIVTVGNPQEVIPNFVNNEEVTKRRGRPPINREVQ